MHIAATEKKRSIATSFLTLIMMTIMAALLISGPDKPDANAATTDEEITWETPLPPKANYYDTLEQLYVKWDFVEKIWRAVDDEHTRCCTMYENTYKIVRDTENDARAKRENYEKLAKGLELNKKHFYYTGYEEVDRKSFEIAFGPDSAGVTHVNNALHEAEEAEAKLQQEPYLSAKRDYEYYSKRREVVGEKWAKTNGWRKDCEREIEAAEEAKAEREQKAQAQLEANGGKKTSQLTPDDAEGAYCATPEELCASFTDLVPGAWYLEPKLPHGRSYVGYAVSQRLLTGYGTNGKVDYSKPTLFGPEDEVTRAQIAAIIYRHEHGSISGGDNLGEPYAGQLADVQGYQWYTRYVSLAEGSGVIKGYDGGPNAGCFGVDDPVTREQLATIVYRYCDYVEHTFGHSEVNPWKYVDGQWERFDDAQSISEWARDGVSFCVETGIMTGIGGTDDFDPQGTATRAQIAKVVTMLTYKVPLAFPYLED